MASIVAGWRILRFVPAVVFALVLALTLTLGCDSQQQTPTGEQPAALGQEQPKYGGVLKTHIIGGAPTNLNPLASGGVSTLGRIAPFYSTLVRLDPAKSTESDSIAPGLAERWEVSAEGKAVTFFLYKNAKWHDGTPVTAADVKYTFDRIMDPKDPEAAGLNLKRQGMAPVMEVAVVDDHTVKFVLTRPSASLLSWLGYGSYFILPKHAFAKMDIAKDVMGSGPFRLKQYQVGVSIEYEKNPDYFLKDRPYVDGVTEFLLKDNSTRIGAFVTKQLDLLRQVDRPLWEDIHKEAPEAQLVDWNSLRLLSVGMNGDRKPFDDVRVRRAISLALDREAAIQIVAQGWGTVGGFNPPGGPFSMTSAELSKMPGYGKDLQAQVAEAKRLMAEAGYSQGFKANIITTAGYPPDEAGAVWVKDQLKKNLNIDTTIDVLAGADYGNRRTPGNFDMDIAWLVSYFADPTGSTGYWLPGNYYRFKDQELFNLLEQQDRTLDVNERKKVIREMETKLLERVPYAVIAWGKSGSARQPWVKNHFESVGLYSNHRYEQVWLEK